MLAVRRTFRLPLNFSIAATAKAGIRSQRASPFGWEQILIRTVATASSPAAKVTSLDHVVLTCADIAATKDFYTKYLGMRAETFSSAAEESVVRHALSFGDQKINLHQHGAEFEPKAQNVQPGSADLCFVTETKVDELLAELKDGGITVLEGGQVVERTGARGKLRSVYIRDPDLNLIE